MKGAKAAKRAYWLGLISTPLAALAAYGTGWGLWHFIAGLLGVVAATVLALVAIIAGIIALIRKPLGLRRHAVIGMIATLPVVFVAGWAINRGVSNPFTHEVTTDLVNVPAFTKLTVRPDRFLGTKGGEAEWRSIHAKAFADIVPVRLSVPPAEAMAKVKTLIAARGWPIAAETADSIEATDSVSPFKFKDDIVILVTPDGNGSRIDMRSISRVGESDLGFNVDRVRAFLADVKG